jgi:hypothetical protein
MQWENLSPITGEGGSIYETDYAFVGSYTCIITALTPSEIFFEDTFTFSLTMFANTLRETFLRRVTSSTVPDPPSGFTLIRATGSCVEFSWTAPNDYGSPIIGYSIEKYNNYSLAWEPSDSSDVSSYTAKGLTLST